MNIICPVSIFVDLNNWEEVLIWLRCPYSLIFALLSEKAFDERTKSKEQRPVPANVNFGCLVSNFR